MANAGTTNRATIIWEGDDMIKKGDSYTLVQNYERHWVQSTQTGHFITILRKDGTKDEIDLRWPDRKRDRSGRVSDIK